MKKLSIILLVLAFSLVFAVPVIANTPESGETVETLQYTKDNYRDAYAGLITDYTDQEVGVGAVLIDQSQIDIITESEVIELVWAYEWKEGFGRIIHYTGMTGRTPVLVLIVQSLEELHYVYAAHEATRFLNMWLEIRFITPGIFE